MAVHRRVSLAKPVFVTILGAALACFDTHAFASHEAAKNGPTRQRANVGSGGGAATEDPARDGTHAGNPSVMPNADGA